MTEDFISDRLAKLRMQRGVSARDMSLSLGQANNYINNIENRKALPSMQAFLAICDYLNVTPSEFFDEDNPNPTKLASLIENLKMLDADSLSSIADIVEKLLRQR